MKKINFIFLFSVVMIIASGIFITDGYCASTYESSVYGIKTQVPDGWKVINMDDEEVPGDFQPVFEMKSKKPIDGKSPVAKMQIKEVTVTDIEKFGRDFLSNLQKQGFRVLRQQIITIDGKPAFDATAEMVVGQIRVKNSWVVMNGKKYLFMLTLSDTDSAAVENEVAQLLDSIQYK